MDKTKPHETLSGRPIAKRVLAKMKLHWQRKIVSIKNVIGGHAMAEELQKTVVSQKELAGLDPAHAAYAYAQNQVSVMSEQLTALKEMAPFADIVSRAEGLYMPSAPPMSPLTTSYFTCWAFFDACAGPANETIGTTILEVGGAFGMHPELLRLIRLMQDSRMGFYIHHGREGNVSILEDLVTTAVYRAIVPAGYRGRRNENWYVRLLPPPIPGGTEHVVFTTPYLVVHPDFGEFRQYTVHLYITQEARAGWTCRHFVSVYRAVLRQELTAVLHQAGFVDLRWLMPADSGFYQPLVLARNATAVHTPSSDWSH
jgi:hypothetical protein